MSEEIGTINGSRPTLPSPPLAELDPVVDNYHGIEVVDPYRWLEEGSSPRTRAWIQAQQEYFRHYLCTLPNRDVIRKQVTESLSVETVEPPIQVRDKLFFLKRLPCQEQACIYVRTGENGEDKLLVDPSIREQGNHISVNILDVSEGAELLAYGVREGGEDAQSVEILDLRTCKVHPWRLPKGYLRGFRLVRDLGAYYSHEVIETPRPNVHALQTVSFGDPIAEYTTFVAGESRHMRLIPAFSPDLSYGLYLVMRAGKPLSHTLYTQCFKKCGMPIAVLCDEFEHELNFEVTNETLFVCTNWNAPNRRIFAVPLESPDFETARTIVPEMDVLIYQWCVTGDRLFVSYVQDLAIETDVYDLQGKLLGRVPYPERGTSYLSSTGPYGNEQYFVFQTYNRPPTVYRYKGEGSPPVVFANPQQPASVPSIVAQRLAMRSSDGVEVPVTVLGKSETLEHRPAPLVLTGYGGNGVALTPQFSPLALFMVNHGVMFGVANLRGGGEFNAMWKEAGKRSGRQKACNDFLSVAEWLVDKAYTKPEILAIAGGSNSGLLVTAVLAQRPELVRCVVCLAPLTDMLRYHLQNSPFSIDEYGSAEDPEDFESLFAYSPYHHIRNGVKYPALLMISGDADHRCDPFHARKFVARMQAAMATDRERPVLLDYSAIRGHMPILPLSFRIEALTNRIAFLCDQLGVGAEE